MSLPRLWILLAVVAWSGASAQDVLLFTVDGDPEDWMGGGGYGEEIYDVVPDTNSTVDLAFHDYGWGRYGSDRADTPPRRVAFAFLFRFWSPTFQGSDPTTIEVIFDTSPDTSFGESTPPWKNFLADYRIGVTGSDGQITNRFYERYVAGQWDTVEGADIDHLEVAMSADRQWIEGEIPWESIGSPGPIGSDDSFTFRWAVMVSKGDYRDYAPDNSNYWDKPWHPYYHEITVVEPMSWGRVKDQPE